MVKLFKLIIFFSLLFSVLSLSFADSNGIWNFAKDLRFGHFGSDEVGYNDSSVYYFFDNPVSFTSNSIFNGYFQSNVDINLNANLRFMNTSINYNCGKLYTENGVVKCGSDNVNDADADPNNELQNLASVLILGNNANNYRIVNVADPINPQDVATKNYVDSKINSNSNYCGEDSYEYKYKNLNLCLSKNISEVSCSCSIPNTAENKGVFLFKIENGIFYSKILSCYTKYGGSCSEKTWIKGGASCNFGHGSCSTSVNILNSLNLKNIFEGSLTWGVAGTCTCSK